MGTIGYMSPEQLRGRAIDARTDIFSLGCMLYEMVTGRRPFQRETAADTSAAILHDDPPAFADAGIQVPAELERTIRQCLGKKPGDRFQSAPQLAVALRASLAGSDVSLPPTRDLGKSATRRRRKAVDSIAVLPLVNSNADPNMEYLSDGITDSIINTLARFPKLRVMARSTVFRYKGREVDAQEVGRALDVRAVLTGRVLQRGNRLTISSELVDVHDGSQLWGEQYSGDAAEIFAIEEAIARAIIEKLRLRVGDRKPRVTKEYTKNAEAYQHYLKGRYHWNKRVETELRKAIGHFELAIERDPNYALAYAGLADSHAILTAWSDCRPEEAFPTAKQMAMKALELDDTLAEAHTSLGYIHVVYEWNWRKAEAEYRRAIELNPSYAHAHHWYAYLLMLQCRFDEARCEIERAQELDPLSLIISANVGYRLYLARQYDAALEQFEKTLAMDANFPSVHYYLGLTYEQQGMFEQSIAAFERAVTLSGRAPSDLGSLGHAYARWGKRDAAQKVLDELFEIAKRRYIPSYHIALISMRLGNMDEAFRWLEKAFSERDFYLIYLKVDQRLDPIRTDPRFLELYRHIGLPA
jgi:serine/threonine-protein kinase